jgi:hypothetical protein
VKITVYSHAAFDDKDHVIVAADATERQAERILQGWGSPEFVRIENAVYDQDERPRTVQVRGNEIRRVEVEE